MTVWWSSSPGARGRNRVPFHADGEHVVLRISSTRLVHSAQRLQRRSAVAHQDDSLHHSGSRSLPTMPSRGAAPSRTWRRRALAPAFQFSARHHDLSDVIQRPDQAQPADVEDCSRAKAAGRRRLVGVGEPLAQLCQGERMALSR